MVQLVFPCSSSSDSGKLNYPFIPWRKIQLAFSPFCRICYLFTFMYLFIVCFWTALAGWMVKAHESIGAAVKPPGDRRDPLQVFDHHPAHYPPAGGVLRHEARSGESVAAHQQGRRAAAQMLAEVSVLERQANHSLRRKQQGSSLSSICILFHTHTQCKHKPSQCIRIE